MRLPRKTKKKLKRLDPELYGINHALSKLGVEFECKRNQNEISIHINSPGGTVYDSVNVQDLLSIRCPPIT